MMGKIKFLNPCLLVLFMLLIFTEYGYSQVKVGQVIDSKSKQPIPAVYISINRKLITATDENGYFSLYELQAKDTLSFSHLIYEHKDFLLSILKGDTLIVKLKTSCFNLNEVDVVESKLKHIIKKAHKLFVKKYQPINCWTKAKCQNVLFENGKAINFFESHGYAMLRKAGRDPYSSGPLLVDENIRRTQTHTPKLFYDLKTYDLNKSFAGTGVGEYGFCERIFPLGKFSFRNYRFKLDTLSDKSDDCYVINFIQKTKMIKGSGWRQWGASGKIWLNRQSFLPKKIAIAYKNRNRVSEFIVTFSSKGNMLFTEHVKAICTDVNRKRKQNANELRITKLSFEDIDIIPRENYHSKNDSMYYLRTLLSPDIKYDTDYWKNYPLNKSEFYPHIKSICKGNFQEEFEKGAKEPISNKKHKYYQSYIDGSDLKESAKRFVQQMYKDLGLKKAL
jgi:hypothetical protein